VGRRAEDGVPFNATVVRVLIASPSDTAAARAALREALEDWNSLHAENAGVMVLPVMWERDAVPEMGDRPQAIINRQLVDVADMLIALFWTRLGTPTSEAESGTAEEVERFLDAGKPVLLYFSAEPVLPDSVDPEQHRRLVEFRTSMEARGLIDRFSTADELSRKASAAVTRTIWERFSTSLPQAHADAPVVSASGPRAQLLARVTREREVRGFSKQGRPRYSTRERLVIENVGSAAAEQLVFRFEVPDTDSGESPSTVGNDEPVSKLPPGGTLEYPLLRHMGTAQDFEIVFAWRENDSDYEDRHSLR
jgi:hypothetical protein